MLQVRLIAIYPRSRLPLELPRFCEGLQQSPLITLSPTTLCLGSTASAAICTVARSLSYAVAFTTCPRCGWPVVACPGVATSRSSHIHHRLLPLHILGSCPYESPTKRSCRHEEPGAPTRFTVRLPDTWRRHCIPSATQPIQIVSVSRAIMDPQIRVFVTDGRFTARVPTVTKSTIQ